MNSPHDELEQLFTHAVGLSPDERARFLEHDVTDHGLRQRLERLLAHDDSPVDPIDSAIGNAAIIATSTDLPASIGAYKPLRRLGAGGMGTVYLAERADGRFQGEVAIKVLSGLFGNDAIARFRRERELLARLDHAHIARLIDAGELPGGTPYVVMEYVDGRPIDSWCREKHLTLEARIRLIADAADAVQHAHRRLVVHRDLKPENVLVRADGVVKLLDFGIARMISDETRQAENATIAYTPGYASPEQRSGAPVTVESDIYSLGVLLAEILVGSQLPRSGDGNPTEFRPSTLVRGRLESARLTGDLDTIVLKATHPDPERRYASAEAFADDLRRHLRRRPIRARPDSTLYRLGRQTQRHPIATLIGIIVSVALVVAAIAFKQQRDHAIAAEQRAAQSATSAKATARFLSELFINADPTLRGDRLSALDLLKLGAERVDTAMVGDPLVRSELKATFATAMMNLGEMQRGLELARDAVAESPQRDDAERVLRVERMRLVAQLQWRTGDPKAALRTVDDALAAMPLDRLPPELVVRLGNTRVTALGRIDVGAEYLATAERNVAYADAHLPDGHFLRAAAASNLAGAYEDLGRYDRLLALRRTAIEQFEADPGSMPGDRWLAQIHYASALMLNGENAQALAVAKPAVEKLVAHYPEPHPNAAFALGKLAAFQNANGDPTAALASAQAALATWAKVEYQRDASTARFEAARALLTLGRSAEAQPFHDALLADDDPQMRKAAEALFSAQH